MSITLSNETLLQFKINPQHTVPTLDDDGYILSNSHAINAYLVDKYGKDDSLYPKDLKKRGVVNQRLFFNEGIFFHALLGVAVSSYCYDVNITQ